jgi:hypothetical protein
MSGHIIFMSDLTLKPFLWSSSHFVLKEANNFLIVVFTYIKFNWVIRDSRVTIKSIIIIIIIQ